MGSRGFVKISAVIAEVQIQVVMNELSLMYCWMKDIDVFGSG